MSDAERVRKFIEKIDATLKKMSETDNNCIICETRSKRHVVILPDSTGDIGFGKPEPRSIRYAIACVCEKHDLNDEDTSDDIRIALEIKKLTNKAVYIKGIDEMED